MNALIALTAVFLIALLGLVVLLAALAMAPGMLVGSIVGVNAVTQLQEQRRGRPEIRRRLAKGLAFAFGPPAVLIACVALMQGLARLALWLTA